MTDKSMDGTFCMIINKDDHTTSIKLSSLLQCTRDDYAPHQGRYVILINSGLQIMIGYSALYDKIAEFNNLDRHYINYRIHRRVIYIQNCNNDALGCMIRIIIKAYQRLILPGLDAVAEYAIQYDDTVIDKIVPWKAAAWDISYTVYRHCVQLDNRSWYCSTSGCAII